MTTLTAETTLEIQITLTGTFSKGCPERGPTYDCGGEPAEPDAVEDISIDRVDMLRAVPFQGTRWDTFNLFEGCADNSPDVATIKANILRVLGSGAEAELMAEAGDW